ncbi:MAG: 2-amino-3-ketobutyrate coenzyme A ligase [Phycisphaerae bacterium]|nr:2-amino-3-ketobutyrate coenzyme A ligase [Phycisphaerae bacterium]
MPGKTFDARTDKLLADLRAGGQYKVLQHLTSPMGPLVRTEEYGEVVCLCSNNYLGLADHPEVVAAGQDALDRYGAGTASVRFICGTFDIHRRLERDIAAFVGTEASLTYVSCWNANEALLPTVAAPEDVIISDELNHASIIDSCRLAKAERVRYAHSDMGELKARLVEHAGRPARWVVTDGVFSMEGDLAKLPELVKLCREHDAMLVVDDSHGIGVLGETGRGTPDHFGLLGEVDVLTGTLGKSLGGAAGGYVAASSRLVDLLVQRSRPSLFSNALPATVAASAGRAIQVVRDEPQRVKRLHDNVAVVRAGLRKLGFDVIESPSAILPIMIGDTAEAIAKSRRLLKLGVWVVGFGYPVVPQGQARLRVQVSAALEDEHIARALEAFAKL